MILIGTSGFSYADWKGKFYPKALNSKEMLDFYARIFPACEINSTYYRFLSPDHANAMVEKAAGRVKFIIKLHQSMTHALTAGETEFRLFLDGITPFIQAGVLGGILAQFPFAFTNQPSNRDYLAALKLKLSPEVPLIVEFRHRSWMNSAVVDFLKHNEINFVNVDEPSLKGLMPPTEVVTGTVGYVRFHGRNHITWFKKDVQPWERYNYLYSEAEIGEWLVRIKNIDAEARTTYVFFNNHWQSQAVKNAYQLASALAINLPNVWGGEGRKLLYL